MKRKKRSKDDIVLSDRESRRKVARLKRLRLNSPVKSNIQAPILKRRRCTSIMLNGKQCGNWTLRGAGIEKCRIHCSEDDLGRNLQALASLDVGRNIDGDLVLCDKMVYPENKPCGEKAIPGYRYCLKHMVSGDRKKWEWYYNRRRNKAQAKSFLKRKATNHKTYDGYLSNEDTESLISCKGELFSFYGSAFMNSDQRKLFTSAPVGQLDDDIKIIRFLVRDSLENQALFIAAQAAGNVDRKGFVTFSKETSLTEDGEGNTILTTARTIKRRQDYLSDIERLTRLLTNMEKVRIDVQAANNEENDRTVPFHFNILPPSKDHPNNQTTELSAEEEEA